MKFYRQIIRTFHDLPGHHAMLIHSLAGCNLHCLGCHNYAELVANQPSDYYSDQDILQQIKQSGSLFDAIIFSGGEFLLENLADIKQLFRHIRSIFPGIIILNSNGSFPQKISALLDEQWIDGVHLDCKLPYHMLDVEEDQDIYQTILGVPIAEPFRQKLLASVKLVVQHGSKYSQIRTVRYPCLDQPFFSAIANYVEELNRVYGSAVPYRVNEFVSVHS